MKNKVSRAYIRLDQYFEKLRVRNRHKTRRKDFDIPEEKAWDTIQEMEKWEEALWKNPDRKREWDEMIAATLNEIGLPESYRRNLEQFLTLDFNGAYDANLPGLPRFRGEDKYLRNKRIFELSLIVDPKTCKKIKAKEVAKRFQPWHADKERDPELELTKKEYEEYEIYMKRHFSTDRKVSEWYRDYGLYEKKDPGLAVRRILSEHKKNFSL